MEFSIKYTDLVTATFQRRTNFKLRSTMSRKIIAFCVHCALLLVCASLSQADDWNSVRSPLGVYAHLDIETAINNYPGSAHTDDGGIALLPSQVSTRVC